MSISATEYYGGAVYKTASAVHDSRFRVITVDTVMSTVQQLENATKLRLGHRFYIIQKGGGDSQVHDGSGSGIANIADGESGVFILADNFTIAGTWIAKVT